MLIADILTADQIVPACRANSKKQVLLELADVAARATGQDARDIFEVLLERERLGTTGVGRGVAIPHGKLATLNRLYGVFTRMETPVDFDSVDDEPVDLIFLLLAPEAAGADHLKALAKVSRLLRDPQTCAKLRGSDTKDALLSLLTEEIASNAA